MKRLIVLSNIAQKMSRKFEGFIRIFFLIVYGAEKFPIQSRAVSFHTVHINTRISFHV